MKMHLFFRSVEGYEIFRALKLMIIHQLAPLFLTVFFNYKNYRYDFAVFQFKTNCILWRPGILSNPECILTKRTMIASTFFCLTNIFHIVPISWELYWTFWSLQVICMNLLCFKMFFQSEGDTKIEMPVWVHLIYKISFFLAILPPAFYAYIFSPPNFLCDFCKVNHTLKNIQKLLSEYYEIAFESCVQIRIDSLLLPYFIFYH